MRDDEDDYFDDGEDGDDDDFTNNTVIFRYDLTENDDFDREEIATYEEVPRLFFQKAITNSITITISKTYVSISTTKTISISNEI